MRNYVQQGEVLDAIAPSGGVVASGAYLIGKAFGVAATTAAEGETFALAVEGVVTLPKASGAISASFPTVYWDDTAKNVTTTASGNTKIGYATAAQASGDATVNVKLIPAA